MTWGDERRVKGTQNTEGTWRKRGFRARERSSPCGIWGGKGAAERPPEGLLPNLLGFKGLPRPPKLSRLEDSAPEGFVSAPRPRSRRVCRRRTLPVASAKRLRATHPQLSREGGGESS